MNARRAACMACRCPVCSQHAVLRRGADTEAAAAVMRGIEAVMAAPDGPKTADIGGSANTVEVGTALAAAVAS